MSASLADSILASEREAGVVAGDLLDGGQQQQRVGPRRIPQEHVKQDIAPFKYPRAIEFPKSMTGSEHGDDFSFSGLKTALLHRVRAHGVPDGQPLADLCASYQAAIVEVLVRKTRRAARRLGLAHVQVCGGVDPQHVAGMDVERSRAPQRIQPRADLRRHAMTVHVPVHAQMA